MAESTPGRKRRDTDDRQDGAGARAPDQPDERDERDDERAGDEDRGGPGLSAKELADAAMDAVVELTGFEPESVSGLEWDGDAWVVNVDALELSRVPETTDVLGTYAVELDDSGVLRGFKRKRRFYRADVEEDDRP
jgi:hypothetical protein